MISPQEALELIANAYNCPDVSVSEAVAAIQKDAYAQGRRDLHQDIKHQILRLPTAPIWRRQVLDTVDACYTKDMK